MGITDLATALFLGLWFGLCLLVYVPRATLTIRRLDQLSLIPEWRFFAPIPMRGDHFLLYRDHYDDGAPTEWVEVFTRRERRWSHTVWNPDKRQNKALMDAVLALVRLLESDPQPPHTSIAYLTILNLVSSLLRIDRPDSIQFLIMYQGSGMEPKMHYVSEMHSLD